MPYMQGSSPHLTANPSSTGLTVSNNWMPDVDKQQETLGAQDFMTRNQYPHDAAMLRQQQAPEMQKLAMQNAHWSALFPYLQGALGGLQGGFNASVGGRSGRGPRISGGPVWDQNAIQQNTNQMRAQGAQQTAGQVQGMQDRLAGSGFGARSPLAAALETQMGMGNQAAVAGQVRDFKNTAATANAQHTLQSQQAQEGQYSNRMQEDIARRRNVIGYQQGLLGLLGQMM